MGYDLSPGELAFLRTDAGREALAAAAALPLSPGTILADLTALRQRHAPYEAAAVEVTRARRKAVGKLRGAGDLLLVDEAVQQATPWALAWHRAGEIAQRFPGAVVHDVTCSVGAELMALACRAGIGGVIGSDIDRARLALADHNLGVARAWAEGGDAGHTLLLRADALTPTTDADVVIADPGRRTSRGRVTRLDDLQPPLLELLAVYTGRRLAVKCAPGLDYRNLRDRFGFEGQVQVVSLDGGVREACLWTGWGAQAERRATVLRSDGHGGVRCYELTSRDPDDLAAPGIGEWIVDPDGAVVRAGLVRQYAHRHGLRQLDPHIAYLTGPRVPAGERGFRVLDRLPMHEKSLRGALAARGCGRLEILVRGVDTDPDRLRKRLRLRGDNAYALVITRIGRSGTAFLCEPGIREPAVGCRSD